MEHHPFPSEPPRDCPLCPRLVAYRAQNAAQHPDWWNGPAPSWGDPEARLLVEGLAPGRTGANRTGRPFTGDHAGLLLYATLKKAGFATGAYDPNGNDDLRLTDCMISNAVRCAPPGNKPETSEENACRPLLTARLAALPRLHTRTFRRGWSEWETLSGRRLPPAPVDREFDHHFYMLEAAAAGLKFAIPYDVTPGSEKVRATIARDGIVETFEKAGATVELK